MTKLSFGSPRSRALGFLPTSTSFYRGPFLFLYYVEPGYRGSLFDDDDFSFEVLPPALVTLDPMDLVLLGYDDGFL